jgi:AraC-like DNA-binding protein
VAPDPVLRFRVPSAPLAGFVAKLWLCDAPALPHARERVLPDGTMTLVVNLADDEVRHYGGDGACHRLPGITLHGPQSAPFVIDTAEQRSVMGVHFAPGGAYPFFGAAAGELRGRHVPLDALWGAGASSLRSELLEARGAEHRFDALERALVRRFAGTPRRHPGMLAALRALASPGSAHRIGTLEERLGVSRKQLARRFDDEVGLAPKRLARILRFQRALGALGGPRGARTLADLALACGYYDHAHFVRDFRAFSGASPSAILAAGGTRANHLALAD